MYHQGFFNLGLGHANNPRHHLNNEHEIMNEEHDANQESENPPAAPVKREKRRYRCRKRSPATIERAKTVRRDKANARERRRMNSLNDALETLREILPALPDEPKMTKIETLRKAQEYIASLSFQLSGGSPTSSSTSTQCCETGSCGMCSLSPSLQSTPFQSPCFPPPQYIASLSFQLSGGSPTSSSTSTQCCETGSCGMCSLSPSLQSTPFQSPCFPPPQSVQYSSYSNPPSHMYYHHQSPHFKH